VLRYEDVDAKRIIEEDFSAYDGLTRRVAEPPALRAGETGTAVHAVAFQQSPQEALRALVLAFRAKRYIKSLAHKTPQEVDYARRMRLVHNGRPLDCKVQVTAGKDARTATRAAADWTWVRLEFERRRFAVGDRLTLTFEFDGAVRVPVVAIRYRVPVLLVGECGECYVEEPFVIPVRGTEAAKLCVDVPSIVQGERVRLRVSALDRIGNLADGFDDVLICRLGGQEVRVPVRGGRAETDELRTPPEGMHKVTVECTHSGLAGQSNYFLVDREGRCGRLVWGDIHGHSISSDGIGTADEHYAYSRDVRHMDVAALTDHDNQIIANGAWPLLQRKAREWSRPGSFVVLPAYEWAQPYEAERNYGHKNFYFRTYAGNPLLSGDAADGTDAETPEKLYAKLAPEQCVIISHHPAYDDWMWTDWDRLRGDREEVIEVYSTHGASDEVGTIKPLPNTNAERTIFANLARRPDLRLGFTGGSDCHAGLLALDFHPDRAAPEDRTWFKPWRGGLTAFRVESLTLDGVLDALKSRRTYATTGEKLLLLVEVNGRLFEPDVKAEVYRNARVCHAAEGLAEAFEYEWRDDAFEAPAFYFVRVTQQDDQIAWSAVTWVS